VADVGLYPYLTSWGGQNAFGSTALLYPSAWPTANTEPLEAWLIGTPHAIIICTQPEPLASAGEMFVTIQVRDPVVLDVYRIYPCCTDIDTLGTVTVEFTYLSGTGTMRWKTEVIGGASSCISYTNVVADVHGEVSLWACADHLTGMTLGRIVGEIETGSTLAWADDCDPGNGRYAGLGHDNTDHVNIFDDFVFGELRKEDGTSCHECWCWCLDVAIPKTLTLEFVNATDRAACLGGVTITLEWEWNAGVPRWYGTTNVTGAVGDGYNGVTVKVEAFLSCDFDDDHNLDWPGHNWVLVLEYDDGENTCCAANQTLCNGDVAAVTSTCDPLNLVFGPYLLTLGDLACYLCYNPASAPNSGTYYAVVTL